MKSSSFLASIPALCALVAAPLQAAPLLSESDVATFHFGVATVLPDPQGRITVDLQHADIGVPFHEGAFDLHVHGDDAGELAAEEALIYANDDTALTMPNLPFYNSFTGAAAGSTIWILPQTQDPDMLFLGFGAEEMDSADMLSLAEWNPGDARGGANVTAKWLRIELVAVRGPGQFSMWANTGFGNPTVLFSTAENGVDETDVVHILAGGHSHYNWGFTQPGEYEVDLRVSTYVVPEPSAALLVGAGMASYVLRRRRMTTRTLI